MRTIALVTLLLCLDAGFDVGAQTRTGPYGTQMPPMPRPRPMEAPQLDWYQPPIRPADSFLPSPRMQQCISRQEWDGSITTTCQ
jgi:hypothetical protein